MIPNDLPQTEQNSATGRRFANGLVDTMWMPSQTGNLGMYLACVFIGSAIFIGFAIRDLVWGPFNAETVPHSSLAILGWALLGLTISGAVLFVDARLRRIGRRDCRLRLNLEQPAPGWFLGVVATLF